MYFMQAEYRFQGPGGGRAKLVYKGSENSEVNDEDFIIPFALPEEAWNARIVKGRERIPRDLRDLKPEGLQTIVLNGNQIFTPSDAQLSWNVNFGTF